MKLLEQIETAGIVGCGGAGFPTHVKMKCQVEYLIINGAECEPLLRTDRWLMKHKASSLVEAAAQVAELVGASRVFFALKETYHEEMASLEQAISSLKSKAKLFPMKNFYPAGDEQSMVCAITGRTVPPAGIPLDVGAVVTNIATLYGIFEAAQGKTFTHKYLTVSGEVGKPVVVYAPIGTRFAECIQAAGGPLLERYRIINGGPLMGKQLRQEDASSQAVTKTTSGILLVPEDIPLITQREIPLQTMLRRARSSCIQCSDCTQMCPRYLSGHPLEPHKIMRRLAFMEDIADVLDDSAVRQAQICSECGICEAYACPMGLQPRQINAYLKGELGKAGIRYTKGEEPTQREEMDWRRIPSKRLATRLGVAPYYDYNIDQLVELAPHQVAIPLKQHIGAPAIAVVEVGQTVSCGQLIGAKPEQGLGANIHASMDGIVTKVNQEITIEGGGR